ncbi:O-antigen ligase family protein [Catenulispora sp. NL8]|uniref:O-antigen ligase family protein n=1 Tax=Catenulispora pinistramenti TaxID=2705254 RepID=A0ABS5KW03_9ACTN|nr:O-antigen ligase family protein [Catenulispora pinistramenti]MBS2550169.1 O-antigen ligase family protein [Catenulispora pinistramenti]
MSAPAPSRIRRATGRRTPAAMSQSPDPATRAPAETKPPRWDATSVLTVYAGLVMLAPATQTVANLGALGAPATIYSVLAFLWFLAGRLTGRLTLDPASGSVRKAMCVLTAAFTLSYIGLSGRSASVLETQAADRALILMLIWCGLVVVASAGITDRARLDTLLRRLVLFGTIVAAIGILEFFSGWQLTEHLIIPGLSTNVDPAATGARGGHLRAQATTTQPLEFGAVIAIHLPFAIQQAGDPARRGPGLRAMLRRYAPVTIMIISLPMTVSRTAIIGLVVVLAVLLPSWPKRRRRPAYVMTLFGAAAVRVLVPGLLGTIMVLFSSASGNADNSTQARTKDYAGVAPYIQQRPWFGRGPATFIPILYRYTDDYYLLALVEIGIVGVLAILVVYFTGIRAGRLGRRLSGDEAYRDLGQCFAAAFAVMLVISATFDTLSFPMLSGLFFLLFGCSGAYLGIARSEAAKADRAAKAAPRPATTTRAGAE